MNILIYFISLRIHKQLIPNLSSIQLFSCSMQILKVGNRLQAVKKIFQFANPYKYIFPYDII